MLYRFASRTLDTRRRELLTENGPVALRPKVFDLLVYLIDHRDRVVSKRELFDQLWPDVHVGDATISTCVKAARQAVGDSGKSQSVIRTWHGHGFRFIAPVEENPSDESPVEENPVEENPVWHDPPVLESSGEGRQGDLDKEVINGSEPRPSPSEATPSAQATPEAGPALLFPLGKEHKQVTVLHCALPEASQLAAKLGAEAMDETMEHFITVAEGAMRRHGGTVSRWLGDGLVALFGAPQAFEDHARRAVWAARDLLARLAEDPGQMPVRIGLHTGPVVVGTTARDPGGVYTAAGTTTDLARALQERAPPAAILASEATYTMVQSEVEAEPFGAAAADSETAPRAYLIRALLTRQAGVPRHGGRQTSRFLGRERELATLRGALEDLSEGSGQVVSISGEPGIGKSRLVEELERDLSGEPVESFRVNCLSQAGTSPYLPVRRLLRQICGFKSAEPPHQALGRLERRLEAAGRAAPLARALLAQLLGLPVDLPDLERLSPEERRTQTFDHLYAIVADICASQPCVIVVEDLHWIDATSEAWLSGLVMRLAGLRLLLVVTYRPGYQAPWLPQSSATQLGLTGLRSKASAALVRSIPTETPLSETELAAIVSKAQGNPFFLEELTRSLGAGGSARRSIPETVQAVLAARIDQLEAAEKRLLQIAAVIGPEVSVSLLEAVDGSADDAWRACLVRLQEAELLYERQAAPDRVFTFKHALTQDVAYLSLVARTRAAIHQRIAAALEAGFKPLVAGQPELLAHHLTESGDGQKAVGYWLQAGQRAVERSANAEAIAHLTKGLELLERLPDNAERDAREIALQLSLGVPLQNTTGPGSRKTERAYRRAIELSRVRGDGLSLFFATWGLWRYHCATFDLPAARDLAANLLDLAKDQKDPTLLMQAHHANWTTLFSHGEIGSAQAHIERGLALYNPQEHRTQAFLVAGHDPNVCAQLTTSQILWITGYPDSAAEQLDHAMRLAKDMGHTSTLAIALNHALRLCLCTRDPESVGRWRDPLRALAEENGFTGHITWCDLVQAWVKAEREGRGEEVAEVLLVLETAPDLAGVEGPMAQSVLVDACRLAGRTAEGLALLKRMPHGADFSDLRFWDAELGRLKGELLLTLAEDHQAEAEACFRSAITTAQEQSAKSLELRSATSLARLWNSQGKRQAAHDLLAPVHAWFTEGHDTRDLVEAKALLETLSCEEATTGS